MILDSQKPQRESPFGKDISSKKNSPSRRFSRFSGMQSNNRGSHNTPSRSPQSPFSKKVSNRSSAKVLEKDSEEYDSEYEDKDDQESFDYRTTFAKDTKRNRKKYII